MGSVHKADEAKKTLKAWLVSMKEDGCWHDIDNLSELLSTEGLDLRSMTDDDGSTLLMYFAKFGPKEAADLLLKELSKNLKEDEFDAYIDAKGDLEWTALMLAAYYGRKAVVELLLEHGADPTLTDDAGKTAADLVPQWAHSAIGDTISSAIEKWNSNSEEKKSEVEARSCGARLFENRKEGSYKADEAKKTLKAWLASMREDNCWHDIDNLGELLSTAGLDLKNIKNDDGSTLLMYFAQFGKKDAADLLLKELSKNLKEDEVVAYIDAKDNVEWTALMIAAQYEHKEMVKLLLENGADVNAKNKKGETALMFAAWSGSKAIVKLVLENGADVNAQNRQGETALMIAAQLGSKEIVELLLEHGADPRLTNNNGRTAADLARQYKHFAIGDTVSSAIEKWNSNSEEKKSEVEARSCGARLFENRKEGSYKADEAKKTLKAWLASMRKDSAWHEIDNLGELLSTAGLDLKNIKNDDGSTLLMYFAKFGKKDAADLLLKELSKNLKEDEFDAYIDAKSELGWTALMKAAESGQKEIVELLLKNRANINDRDNEGWTALMIAAYNGHNEIVELLLENGANVNAKSKYGYTALMFAAYNGHKEIVELLLENGADPRLTDNKGMTAAYWARQKGHSEIGNTVSSAIEKWNSNSDEAKKTLTAWLALMKQDGCWHDIDNLGERLSTEGLDLRNVQDNEGSTLLMYFAQFGKKDAADLLLDKLAENLNKDELSTYINAKRHYLISGWLNWWNGDGRTALMLAAKSGQKEMVELLLKNRANINAQDYTGKTALMLAAESGQKEIAELLLKNRADVNAKNKYGETAWMLAAEFGHKEIVELLLENGADVNAEDSEGWTALMLAAKSGHKEVVELLLENGADVNAKHEYGYTALMFAAKSGHKEVVELLLENGADVNAKDEHGYTALMLAACAEDENEDIVQLLLDNGANVHAEAYGGDTALVLAAKSGHEKIVELLLKNGVRARSWYGREALRLAEWSEHEGVVKLLIDNGAVKTVNAQDGYGDMKLTDAVSSGQEGVVKLVLEIGADVNAENYEGYTALMLAAKSRQKGVVKLLIDDGADVNAQDDSYGKTALMFAVEAVDDEIVELLLEHGADVNAKNKKGETALMFAAWSGSKAIVKLVLENGADVNAQNRQGETALMIAAQLGSKEIVELLLENGADPRLTDHKGRTAADRASHDPLKIRDTISSAIEKWNSDGARVAPSAVCGRADRAKRKLETWLASMKEDEGWYDIDNLGKLLSTEGLDLRSITDDEGSTLLMYFARYGEKDAADLLLQELSKNLNKDELSNYINAKNNNDETALMFAISFGETKIAELLLQNGADVNAQDNEGWTALMIAACTKDEEIVKLLLDNNADVNAQDKEGETALMKAADSGSKGIVRLLLENGADPRLTDNKGRTAADWARQCKHSAIGDTISSAIEKWNSNSEEKKFEVEARSCGAVSEARKEYDLSDSEQKMDFWREVVVGVRRRGTMRSRNLTGAEKDAMNDIINTAIDEVVELVKTLTDGHYKVGEFVDDFILQGENGKYVPLMNQKLWKRYNEQCNNR